MPSVTIIAPAEGATVSQVVTFAATASAPGGVNKVRFPTPVVAGSRVRAGAEIASGEDIPGGVQVVIKITVELEGSDKPACVVENVTRYLR